jgi:hypothetical protein
LRAVEEANTAVKILVAFGLMWRATLEAMLKATLELRVATKPKP